MGFPGGSRALINPGIQPTSPAFFTSAGDVDWIPGLVRALEKEMATHSSILAWEIPWIEEPGGLQSMGSQEMDTT